jgi:hypothetical protein
VGAKPIKRVLSREQFNDMLRDNPPPTSGEVTITSDGRRLDSAEAVIAFFAELEASHPTHP